MYTLIQTHDNLILINNDFIPIDFEGYLFQVDHPIIHTSEIDHVTYPSDKYGDEWSKVFASQNQVDGLPLLVLRKKVRVDIGMKKSYSEWRDKLYTRINLENALMEITSYVATKGVGDKRQTPQSFVKEWIEEKSKSLKPILKKWWRVEVNINRGNTVTVTKIIS